MRALLAASAEHPKATLKLVMLTPERADDVPSPIAVRSGRPGCSRREGSKISAFARARARRFGL